MNKLVLVTGWILISLVNFVVAVCIYGLVWGSPPDAAPASAPERCCGPSVDAPTLDYESMAGFDPQTMKMLEDRERIAGLEDRVQRLERIVLAAPGSAIGAKGPAESPIYEAPLQGEQPLDRNDEINPGGA